MAKWYYANAYVDVGSYVASPGEVIEGDFPKEDIARWKKLGAISECDAPVGVSDNSGAEDEYEDEGPDEEAPEGADSEVAPGGEADETGEQEPDPAIIDAMDGITAPAAPRTTRKSRNGGKVK